MRVVLLASRLRVSQSLLNSGLFKHGLATVEIEETVEIGLNPFLIQVFLNRECILSTFTRDGQRRLNPFLIQVFLNKQQIETKTIAEAQPSQSLLNSGLFKHLQRHNYLQVPGKSLNPFLIQVFLNFGTLKTCNADDPASGLNPFLIQVFLNLLINSRCLCSSTGSQSLLNSGLFKPRPLNTMEKQVFDTYFSRTIEPYLVIFIFTSFLWFNIMLN